MPEPSLPDWQGAVLAAQERARATNTASPEERAQDAEKRSQERVQREHERAEAARQVARRKALEDVPARYRDAEATHPDVAAWALDVAHGGTDSLVLLGLVGRGKTHQAWGAVHKIREITEEQDAAVWASAPSRQVIVWKVPDLLDALRPRAGTEDDRDAILRNARECDVLYLDDLAAEKSSEWTGEILYRIMDARWENALPTLVTTNVSLQNLAAAAGERLLSRLAGMGRIVTLEGPDLRISPPPRPPRLRPIR